MSEYVRETGAHLAHDLQLGGLLFLLLVRFHLLLAGHPIFRGKQKLWMITILNVIFGNL